MCFDGTFCLDKLYLVRHLCYLTGFCLGILITWTAPDQSDHAIKHKKLIWYAAHLNCSYRLYSTNNAGMGCHCCVSEWCMGLPQVNSWEKHGTIDFKQSNYRLNFFLVYYTTKFMHHSCYTLIYRLSLTRKVSAPISRQSLIPDT